MNAHTHNSALLTFNKRLEESERFHMAVGKVHQTLTALAADLDGAGIDYVIVGALALNAHGYQRETVDVDVLVRPADLDAFHARFAGRGYLPTFEGARKSFRNTKTGVLVEFLTTGEYPGDGKPKPVAFPDPTDVSVEAQGTLVVNLPTLVELKLASGMTNPGRLKDLADVQELTRALSLDNSFAEKLHPWVRDKFLELRAALQDDPPAN